MALIIVVTGPNNGDYSPLGETPIIIGRDDKCDLQIVDPVVSRKHLRVEFDSVSNCTRAINLSSTNGTRINDHEVETDATLNDGDVIQIGDTLLLYVVKDVPDIEEAVNNYRRRGVGKHSTLIK
ncbi:MAG: FHA domain-containing protein [Planctomycetes bacterium]|nr:FHA domain-containing protein [Planctomycetota bacterium]